MKHVIFDCDGTLVDTSGPKYKLFPGIKELLLAHAEECVFYVWTARGRQSTIRILGELGIAAYFDSLSTPDDSIPKPHIAGLFNLVGNAPKQSICVIGDSSNDILGAKNFGVLAIGASWNKDVRPEILTDVGADFIVSHPSECSKLFQLNLKAE
jgi:phosphoglycolate phosphatase-like HAD superfamily hydrolase